MRGPQREACGRGLVRGVFLSALLGLTLVGCDNKPAPSNSDSSASKPDANKTAADAGAADASVADLPPPPPAPFNPPWTTLAPTLAEVTTASGTAEIGKMSGENWGTDKVVRAIARSQCGNGALIQAIFEGPKGLQVSPAMPIRFIGLKTGKSVSYSEEDVFRVTLDFSEDSPERLAGKLKILYDEHGQEKTYIDLEVDAKPLPMLLQPKIDGDTKFPEFQSCHPSGRFTAKTVDGRTAQGYVNAATSTDGSGVVMTVLFDSQSGLRLIAYSQNALDEPWTIDLSKDAEGAPVRLIVEAFHTPELTTPDTAQGPNIGSEQKIRVRHGKASLLWTKDKHPKVSFSFEGLSVPPLLNGPLRGAMFEELRVEAVGYGEGEYPEPPPAEPLGAPSQE